MMATPPIIAQCLEYAIHDFGGVEVLVLKLIQELSKDFKIVLVSKDKPGSLDGSPLAPFLLKHIALPEEPFTQASSKDLARQLQTAGVQLAHFHAGTYGWGNRIINRCPMIYVRRTGIPVVFTNHGAFTLFDYCAHNKPLWFKLAVLPYAWLAKLQAIAHCETEIAVSHNDLGNLRRWYWPLKEKFRVVYHSKLNPEPPAPNLGRKPVILYVGTIGHRKGHVFLAKAFAQIADRHPDWRLVLAGRFATPELYEQILSIRRDSRLEARIELNDQLSDEEVAELMRTSEIFVMPSLYEGLGLSLQEAQYRGCACIASRAGGMQDLIEHEVDGLQVEAGNVEQLASALEKLIGDRALRERFSQAGRASILAKGMTAPQMVENYSAIYREFLSKTVNPHLQG